METLNFQDDSVLVLAEGIDEDTLQILLFQCVSLRKLLKGLRVVHL